MTRSTRSIVPAVLCAFALLLAAGAQAQQVCGYDNSGFYSCWNEQQSCNPTFTCTRQYTSAPFVGRNASGQCLYQCNWTDTTTNSCTNEQTMTNGTAQIAAGPWTNNYCEPAVNPAYFCGYFFGTSC